MKDNDYRLVTSLCKGAVIELEQGSSRISVCPGFGGRIFAEVAGQSVHRIDMENIRCPSRPFNNFGGGNFWPAPEGGPFGFNYDGDQWRVQPCINSRPFEVVFRGKRQVDIAKRVTLVNRAESEVEAEMSRSLRTREEVIDELSGFDLKGYAAYETTDIFRVINRVCTEEALLASWTLEQFHASDDTISFCAVPEPENAINFDFYEHPGDRISYTERGFTYKTDGRKMGQIGVRDRSGVRLIGFYDIPRQFVCIRKNRGGRPGIRFNIADNEQPDGPYSAADSYSIYNSDPEMRAFELEIIGEAEVADGLLLGSTLVSETSLAVFENAGDIKVLLNRLIGQNGDHYEQMARATRENLLVRPVCPERSGDSVQPV